jgi:hypothetical protein
MEGFPALKDRADWYQNERVRKVMTTDWRHLVLEIQPKAILSDPAFEAEIAKAEESVGCPFPTDIRSLLSQTNGVLDEWKYGPMRPLSHIVEHTLFMRSVDLNQEYDGSGISLNSFVTIATDPGGGLFGFFFDTQEGTGINYFEHEEGIFEKPAYTLEQYLRYYFQELSSFSE